MKKLILLFIFPLIITGCASKTSDYLANKPILIIPDIHSTRSDQQERASRIFLKALNKYKWQIRSVDDINHSIVAEACRRGMHCAEIEATIMEDATVSIIRTPGQNLTLNEGNMLKQWVGMLQREYIKNIKDLRYAR